VFSLSNFFFLFFQRIINREKQRSTRAKSSNEKILKECGLLRERLQEEQYNLTVDPSSLPGALDLLAASDGQIQFLIAEVKFLLLLLLFTPNRYSAELQIKLINWRSSFS
jgi:hypothetical protein